MSVQASGDVLLSPRPPAEPGVDPVFEQLFSEHYPRLVRTLLRLAGDPGRAEELAAEAFYRLYQRSPDRVAAEGNAAGWLYRTAINLGLDALRADSRRQRR
jgi:DNA-directed RNA polymerase specialized sigma24 family protein